MNQYYSGGKQYVDIRYVGLEWGMECKTLQNGGWGKAC